MRYNELKNRSPDQLDFVPRERKGQVWNLIIAFAVTIVVIFITSYLSHAKDQPLVPGYSVLVLGALCFYVVYRKQQTLDLLLTTEYQNMLFAQAISMGSNFSMIVRRDGTIVYANDGLRQLFPHMTYGDSQALEAVFEQGGVNKADRERMLAAIYTNSTERLVFPIKNKAGEEKDFVLTLEPLPRPAGFVVIRGREYRDQRSGLQLMPDVLRSTSADKLNHLLAKTPVAHYTTDAFGRLEYINPAMENLLGYAAGEMVDAKLSIQKLFYQLNGKSLPDDYTIQDFSGEALLMNRQGTLVSGFVSLYLQRDNLGKVIGATGSIQPTLKP